MFLSDDTEFIKLWAIYRDSILKKRATDKQTKLAEYGREDNDDAVQYIFTPISRRHYRSDCGRIKKIRRPLLF